MPSTSTTYAAVLAISCALSFFLGREYEYSKLKDTYISQSETDTTTGKTIERRIYYR